MSWTRKASQISWSGTDKGLVITITPEFMQELKDRAAGGENMQSDSLMYEILEPLVQNGLDWIRPEEIGALTDAPIIGDTARDDHGELTETHSVYWYPNYALKSPVQELMEKGSVTFEAAK